jgi:hypothetical protein
MPSERTEPPFVTFQGYVRDAGGGVVTIVVDRDTESYPPVGTEVVVVRARIAPGLAAVDAARVAVDALDTFIATWRIDRARPR